MRQIAALGCASFTIAISLLLARARISPSPPDRPIAAPIVRAEPAMPLYPAPSPAPELRSPVFSYAPVQLERESDGADVIVYPPLRTSSKKTDRPPSLVVMLHGMCSEARATCDFWSSAGRDGSFLVCPNGNSRCADGDPNWEGSAESKAVSIDQTLAALDRAAGFPVGGDSDVLIGFSRGAFVARDVIYARPGRWEAVIFLGAALTPDPDRLRAAGIRRVVMAAGEYDGARPTMQRAARKLEASGLPARYVSLGKIYHALPSDLEVILQGAIRWARERSES
jgi:predicted esterase